jgi:hypothetical protein
MKPLIYKFIIPMSYPEEDTKRDKIMTVNYGKRRHK